MDVNPDVVLQTVSAFSDFLLRYFVALAAVGALAMAIVELWKKVRNSQMRFHAKVVTRWFGDTANGASRAQAYAELIHLTTGVPETSAAEAAQALLARGGLDAGPVWVKSTAEHALFALSLEQMMGHVQDAVDMALDTPQRYEALYRFAVSGADSGDVAYWRDRAQDVPGADDPKPDRAQAKRRAELYARLHQVAKRKLDAFQVYVGDRWVHGNQFWANVTGVIVLFGALYWIKTTAAGSLTWTSVVALSLLGGVLAPVAKDIIVALRKVSQGG